MAGNPINPTPRVKQVLLLARREAERFNHPHIGTEHLLLGGDAMLGRVVNESRKVASGILAVQIALDYAVNVKVRITSDRRCEVAVELRCQTEVAQTVGAVSCLRHRP